MALNDLTKDDLDGILKAYEMINEKENPSKKEVLEQGPVATGKAAISGQESQKKQYLSGREGRAQPLHLRQRRR